MGSEMCIRDSIYITDGTLSNHVVLSRPSSWSTVLEDPLSSADVSVFSKVLPERGTCDEKGTGARQSPRLPTVPR